VAAGSTITVVITGSGLERASALNFDRADVTATIASASPTRVQARISTTASSVVGERNFVLTTPRGRLNAADFGLSFTVARRYSIPRSGSPVVGGDLV
jgi:hypothetical protein